MPPLTPDSRLLDMVKGVGDMDPQSGASVARDDEETAIALSRHFISLQ